MIVHKPAGEPGIHPWCPIVFDMLQKWEKVVKCFLQTEKKRCSPFELILPALEEYITRYSVRNAKLSIEFFHMKTKNGDKFRNILLQRVVKFAKFLFSVLYSDETPNRKTVLSLNSRLMIY